MVGTCRYYTLHALIKKYDVCDELSIYYLIGGADNKVGYMPEYMQNQSKSSCLRKN